MHVGTDSVLYQLSPVAGEKARLSGLSGASRSASNRESCLRSLPRGSAHEMTVAEKSQESLSVGGDWEASNMAQFKSEGFRTRKTDEITLPEFRNLRAQL